MTVHVHASISSIDAGTADNPHHHTREGLRRTKKGKIKKAKGVGEATDRTWSFNCTPDCEAAVLAGVPQTANHPAGVPLTYDEELRVKDDQQQANVDMGHLARALKVATEMERAGAPA